VILKYLSFFFLLLFNKMNKSNVLNFLINWRGIFALTLLIKRGIEKKGKSNRSLGRLILFCDSIKMFELIIYLIIFIVTAIIFQLVRALFFTFRGIFESKITEAFCCYWTSAILNYYYVNKFNILNYYALNSLGEC